MKEVKRPVVSVVVPVYNTEPFLAECLHSLEKQTLTDIEIILVNDGSTDNSGRLLQEYADKDARFVYVEQENQGLSAARNTGMEHASGHYLAFLDSDDWLAENALQVLCAIAAKTRTDIVSGNTLAVHADGQVQSWERRGRELFATGTVVSGSTYFSRVMDCRCYVPMVYNYLYRRDFIEQNGFRFEPGLVHEDELWTPQVLTTAQKITVADIDFYYYRQREGSIMTATAAGRRIASIQLIIEKLLEYSRKHLFEKKYREAKEALYVRLLQIYSTACTLHPDGTYTTLYDRAGEMLRVCEELRRQESLGRWYSEEILNRMKLYYDRLQTMEG